MMIFTNLCIKKGKGNKEYSLQFIKVLSPFAPHLAEEFWEIYGNKSSLAGEHFPGMMKLIYKRIRLNIRFPLMANSGLKLNYR